MRIRYIHHSGFAVYAKDATMVFDYFDPGHDKGESVVPLPQDVFSRPEVPLYFFVSHAHHDHFTPSVLTLKDKHPDVRFMLSFDLLNSGKAGITDGVFFSPGGKYDDGTVYVQTYDSTDEGVSFYVNVGGFRLFHAGDLNNWHWADESTPEEIADANRSYKEVLRRLACDHPNLDAAFFPVDPRMGNNYAKGADEFLSAIEVKHFFPMHFWGNYKAAASFAARHAGDDTVFHVPTEKGELFETDCV